MNNKKWISILMMLGLLFLVAACAPAGSEPASDEMESMEEMDEEMEEMEHDDDEMDHSEMEDMEHDHADHDHGDDQARIMNEGALIEITSPATGDTFTVGEQVLVEVDVENFELGVDGSHWHVYVNGDSWGMVLGGNEDQPLTGLPAGQHMIETYLANGDHEELMQGDSVMIVVEE